MKISGIYKIESRIKPDRFYIGSSINIHRRWRHHYCDLRKHTHHSLKLQRHYDNYGENDLLFSVIKQCPGSKLIETEQFYFDLLNPYFNNSPTAGNNIGIKRSEEAIEKQRKSMIGKRWTDEQRQKFSGKVKGIPKSEEHKRNLSKANKGVSKPLRSEEYRYNISVAKMGEKNGMYGKTPWNKGMAGKYPETIRKKMSESARGRIPWNKGKIKVNGIYIDRDRNEIKQSPESNT